jgi:adenylate cyclase
MLQPVPVNETDRLAALALHQVLDTPPEFAHDALTELAAQMNHCRRSSSRLLERQRGRLNLVLGECLLRALSGH